MTRILVVGDAMLDRYLFGDVDRVSAEAPVPIVKVTREDLRLGGAANVAHNCQTLGAYTTFLTVLGDDSAGASIEQLCYNANIQLRVATVHNSDYRTTTKLRVVGRQQQIVRADVEDEVDDSARDQLLQVYNDTLNEHDIVVISDYQKGAIVDPRPYIAAARDRNIRVVVDTKAGSYAPFAGCFCLKQNRHEWERVADLHNHFIPARVCVDYNIHGMLITHADKGMVLCETNRPDVDIPSAAREVFDVAGAGDTVMAALAVFLAQEYSLRAAAELANRAAGIVVGKVGTATVTQDELIDKGMVR